MSQEWYVHRQGQQSGPLTWEQLRQLAQAGRLQADDQVWSAAMADWTPAREIHGLSDVLGSLGPAAAPAPLPAATPTTGPRTGIIVAAVLGAAILLIGGCGGAYLLFFRDGGLAAFPGLMSPTTAPSPTATVAPPPTATEEPAPTDTTEPSASPTDPADQLTEPPTEQPTEQPTETSETPDAEEVGAAEPVTVVEDFLLVTLGTLPKATFDYEAAQALMTEAYAAEYETPDWVPQVYGIQDGPTSYEIGGEEIAGSSATVTVLGYWGTDLGREWRFTAEQEGGAWKVANIEIVEEVVVGGGDAGSSAFWQLNPVVSEFTVYDNGGYKLVVDFDQPSQDIEATFRIAYFRQDDGILAYDQERTGLIEAGRERLTLDSDWSGYDLYALGFQPGAHDVIATIDNVEIASGELTVN